MWRLRGERQFADRQAADQQCSADFAIVREVDERVVQSARQEAPGVSGSRNGTIPIDGSMSEVDVEITDIESAR